MKTLLLATFVSIGFLGQAATASTQLAAKTGSVIWFDGDSTLHPFSCRTTQVQASSSWDIPAVSTSGGIRPVFDAILQRNALKTFDVVIPVTSLTSKESALDKNMYKALKTEKCPDISFHLSNYVVSKDTTSAGPLHAEVNGTLAIACREQPVTLEMNLASGPDTLHVQGHYTLLMTDYGVKPPTLMLGAIKVKNPVLIHFDLQLAPAN